MILSVVMFGGGLTRLVMAQNQMEGPIFVPVPHAVTHNQSLPNQGQTSQQQQPLLTPEQSAKFLGKKLDKMNELLANITAELHILLSNSRAR